MLPGGLLSVNGDHSTTFSLQSASADNVAESDVKIEDMSHAMLGHRDSVVVVSQTSFTDMGHGVAKDSAIGEERQG